MLSKSALVVSVWGVDGFTLTPIVTVFRRDESPFAKHPCGAPAGTIAPVVKRSRGEQARIATVGSVEMARGI